MLTIVFGFSTTPMICQINFWDDNHYEIVSRQEAGNHSAVVLKDRRYIEYLTNDVGELGMRITYSSKIHLIDQINRYARLYIPLSLNNRILDLRMKIISPEGVMRPIDYNGNRYISNCPQGNVMCEVFQFSEARPYDQIEYSYTFLSNYTPYGREIFQREIPVREVDFQIFHPDQLIFKTQAYNGQLNSQHLPAFRDELYALNSANKFRIDYKVINRNLGATNTWIPIVNEIIERLYDQFPSDSFLVFCDTLKKINQTEPENIVLRIEELIKSSVKLVKTGKPRFENIDSILHSRQANAIGMTKLMLRSLNEVSIYPEIVASCPRRVANFDPGFPTYLNVDELILYFPRSNQYINPYHPTFRLGAPQSEVANNNALFIRYIDSINSLNYRIDKVEMPSPYFTKTGVSAVFIMDTLFREVKIKKHSWSTGYRASEALEFLNSDSPVKDRFLDQQSISDMPISHRDSMDYYISEIKPKNQLRNIQTNVYSEMRSTELIQFDEGMLTIKIGKVIGPQTKLLDSVDRQNNIDLVYPLVYHHQISAVIPKDYRLANAEDLDIAEAVVGTQDTLADFNLDYSWVGDTISLIVTEGYYQSSIDKTYYSDFKKVINSAVRFYELELKFEKHQRPNPKSLRQY